LTWIAGQDLIVIIFEGFLSRPKEGNVITKTPNFVSSRRQFLQNILPAGTMFCFGCIHLSASIQSEKKPQISEKRHKFLSDSGMSIQEVYRFTFQHYFIPLMDNISNVMGEEKFMGMLKEASADIGAQNMKRMTQNLPKRDLTAMAFYLKANPLFQKALTFEIVEESENVLEIRVAECLWAKTFREADAPDIGYAAICYPDFAMASAYNPKIKLLRTKTLMQGHDCCDHKYVIVSSRRSMEYF
jgi:hypothetical protein